MGSNKNLDGAVGHVGSTLGLTEQLATQPILGNQFTLHPVADAPFTHPRTLRSRCNLLGIVASQGIINTPGSLNIRQFDGHWPTTLLIDFALPEAVADDLELHRLDRIASHTLTTPIGLLHRRSPQIVDEALGRRIAEVPTTQAGGRLDRLAGLVRVEEIEPVGCSQTGRERRQEGAQGSQVVLTDGKDRPAPRIFQYLTELGDETQLRFTITRIDAEELLKLVEDEELFALRWLLIEVGCQV